MRKQAKPTPGHPVLLDDTVLVRTACMPLRVSPGQDAILKELQAEFNLACNRVANRAVEHRCWNRVNLHKHAYSAVRAVSPLKSQFVIGAITKVCAAYKALQGNGQIPAKGKGSCPLVRFDKGAVHYDARTFALTTEACPVSGKVSGQVALTILGHQVPTDRSARDALSVFQGRMSLEVVIGPRQAAMLATGRWREADLVFNRSSKDWELHLALEYDRPALANPHGHWVGVDVGDNVLVATSSGQRVEGGALKHTRLLYQSHRDRLSVNGSQSAKQTLRRVSGQESRFVMNACRMLALQVVEEALLAGARGLALEDLTGIHKKHTRQAKRANKTMRKRLRNWPYAKIKAALVECAMIHGLEIFLVAPAYSSQTCSECGQLGVRNKHAFSCQCGYRAHSDFNASVNLAAVGTGFFGSPQGASQRAPEHELEISTRPSHRDHGYDKLRPLGRSS